MTSRTNTPSPPGRRFLYWLAEAAKQVRTNAQVRPERIAAPLEVGVDTIRRFEAAQHWPREVDQVIAVYAEIGGLDDPREIYQRALDLWYEHGSAPLVGRHDERTLSAPERFVEAMKVRPRSPREPARTTTATPKRQAGS